MYPFLFQSGACVRDPTSESMCIGVSSGLIVTALPVCEEKREGSRGLLHVFAREGDKERRPMRRGSADWV